MLGFSSVKTSGFLHDQFNFVITLDLIRLIFALLLFVARPLFVLFFYLCTVQIAEGSCSGADWVCSEAAAKQQCRFQSRKGFPKAGDHQDSASESP